MIGKMDFQPVRRNNPCIIGAKYPLTQYRDTKIKENIVKIGYFQRLVLTTIEI